MKIVGYVDKWSAHAGQALTFHVSCTEDEYRVELRRLIHGDDNPAGPGIKEHVISHSLNGRVFKGRSQAILKGSCMIVPSLPEGDVMLVTGAFKATRTGSARDQAVVAVRVGAMTLSVKLRAGILTLETVSENSARERACASKPVAENVWYRFAMKLSVSSGSVEFFFSRNHPFPFSSGDECVSGFFEFSRGTSRAECLLFGASRASRVRRQWHVDDPLNGRLADLRLFVGEEGVRKALDAWRVRGTPDIRPSAAWDFVRDANTDTVPDREGGYDGQMVNRPVRLITGPDFWGETINPFELPHLFNAAHFHDDDLSDAGWDASFSLVVPEDLPSGVYAFRLTCENAEDYIPFIVTPAPGKETTRVAVLLPTVSYQVYANTRMDVTVLPAEILPLADRDSESSPEEKYVHENCLYSCYDLHSDGSGVCMATNLRPLPIFVRPRSPNRLNGGQHQLSADLHLIDWLEEKKIAYEVITDHDLHFRGVEALSPYRVVLTGTHAEYWSSDMLDALRDYQQHGGRFLYLSGNGLYWVAELNEDGSLVEIRRDQGLRTWDAAPGEAFISLAGTRGGTWRHRGRAPQKYVGVGQAAMGLDNGRPYTRTAASYDSRAAFLFAGITDDLIGNFPSLVSGFGAAGMEIDRVAYDLGTPSHALVLATATGFSDAYQLDIQDVGAATPYFGGSTHPDVRADIVFFETPNGGAVLSVGSIAWCSTLSYNNYNNNVSVFTENAVRSFMADGDLPFTKADHVDDPYA